MSLSQTHYTLLQIKPEADLETVKHAYRKRIRRYHPDQFAARLSQLKQTGTPSAVKQLEAEIERAKQMTQRINAAYAVLSDTTQRAQYDQYLSDERQRAYNEQIRRQRMQHWEGERRTVKSRPHHRNPNLRMKPPREGVPWAILAAFIVLLLVVSALFSNAITRSYTPFTTYVPSNPTSEGSILALDLQATTSSEHATRIARATLAFEPTPTPRSSLLNETLADRLMSFGQYQLAIDAYTDALNGNPDSAVLYHKRATAHVARYQEGQSADYQPALADYTQAITLDSTYAESYLGRGLLYYELWSTGEATAEQVRADLTQYLAFDPPVDTSTVEDILASLP
ncbi:MAG: DnaJ domain-containing protein [Anaerolineae bacterium]